MKLIIEDLKKVLHYQPETGIFTWKGGYKNPGDQAGVQGDGRRQIGYEGRTYRESRLAWAFMTGDWPPKGFDVEHKDEDPLNNKWTNLRLATRGQNVHNRVKPRSDNKSGHTGVHWRKGRKPGTGKWHARIKTPEQIICLGDFDDKAEAIQVRVEAEKHYLGEFAPNREM